MIRGCIAHLRSVGKHLRRSDLYNLFASRISADYDASVHQLPLSALGLTPTNAFLNVPPRDVLQLGSANPTDSLMYNIPVAVKDNFCSDSSQWIVPTTCASRTLKHYHAPYNAAVVASLSNAGCIFMGKTNMDEYAMGCGSTDGRISGAVINPWSCMQTSQDHSAVIAGGSSGGSAAAVAAGLCVAAVASDTGGSARLPAANCGVIGLKPTYGLVSRHGLVPLANSLDTPSIISSSVADAAAVLATWLRPENPSARLRDATCAPFVDTHLKQTSLDLSELASSAVPQWHKLDRVSVGIPAEYHAPGLCEEVCSIWDSTADWLASGKLSCTVKPVRLPHTPMATEVYSVLCATEVASNMTRYDGLKYGFRADESSDGCARAFDSAEALFACTRSQGFGQVVRSRILAGNFFLLRNQQSRYLDAARRLWRLVIQDFQEVFQHVDFLLTPVILGPAARLSDFVLLNNRTRTTLDDVCTVGANLAGLPAISIPISLSPSTGLPLGLQLIGPAFSEVRLLQLASYLEARARFSPLVDIKSLIDEL